MFSVSTYGDSCHVGADCPFRTSKGNAELNFALGKRFHFTPWGWGIWRDRFEEFSDEYVGWDMQMNFQVNMETEGSGNIQHSKPGARRDRVEVFPVLSRSNNIGLDGGIHADLMSHEQMRKQQYLTFWSQNVTLPTHKPFNRVAYNELCNTIAFGPDTLKYMCGIEQTRQALAKLTEPRPFRWPVGEGPPEEAAVSTIITEAEARKAQGRAQALYEGGKEDEAIKFDIALAQYLVGVGHEGAKHVLDRVLQLRPNHRRAKELSELVN